MTVGAESEPGEKRNAGGKVGPRTLLDKIWDRNLVHSEPGHPDLLYVDLHLVHEVTSPQAFDGLRLAGRKVRRPDLTVATVDHNVPTWPRSLPVKDDIARQQMDALRRNVEEFQVPFFDVDDPNQGIVHVIGPELGYTQPGMIIVCGDSHTSTHGAFGALAFGIGTSQVEHVLATQCIRMDRPPSLEVRVEGDLPPGVTAKDLILAIIRKIGVAGGQGHAIEYTGSAIRALTMEERMTVCNMSIEGGARAGMISPDSTTVDFLRGRERVPHGSAFEELAEEWLSLATDPGAEFQRRVTLDAGALEPVVTWGTTPAMSDLISGRVPHPGDFPDAAQQEAVARALEYMDLRPGTPICEIPVDRVFIGSCTNARLADLQAAAQVISGKKVNPGVRAMVVPGSTRVKQEAEALGLDRAFTEAGFEWREAGCSMCLGMNPDILEPGERCASTSNRNFEGRQGRGGRTHLVSPAMAAAAAVAGHFVDVRSWSGS